MAFQHVDRMSGARASAAAVALPPGVGSASAHQTLVGDVAAICRLAAQHALEAMNATTKQADSL
jgi:hypothetical protein